MAAEVCSVLRTHHGTDQDVEWLRQHGRPSSGFVDLPCCIVEHKAAATPDVRGRYEWMAGGAGTLWGYAARADLLAISICTDAAEGTFLWALVPLRGRVFRSTPTFCSAAGVALQAGRLHLTEADFRAAFEGYMPSADPWDVGGSLRTMMQTFLLEKANSARAHWSPCKDDAPRSAVASGTRAARAAGA